MDCWISLSQRKGIRRWHLTDIFQHVTPSENNFGETEFVFHRFELNWLTEWAGQCSVARLDEHFDGVDCVRQEPYQTEARLADGCFLRDSLANSFAFQ